MKESQLWTIYLAMTGHIVGNVHRPIKAGFQKIATNDPAET